MVDGGNRRRRHRGPPGRPPLHTGRRCARPAVQDHSSADRRRPPRPGRGIPPACGSAGPLARSQQRVTGALARRGSKGSPGAEPGPRKPEVQRSAGVAPSSSIARRHLAPPTRRPDYRGSAPSSRRATQAPPPRAIGDGGRGLPMASPILCQPSQPLGSLDRWNHPRCQNKWHVVRFGFRPYGYRAQYVPNVGMARTIGQILVIQLLGHRRTCQTSPPDQWFASARRPGRHDQLGADRWPLARPAESLRGRRQRGPAVPSTVGRGAEAGVDRIMVAVAIGMALVFAFGVLLGFLVTISMASNGRTGWVR